MNKSVMALTATFFITIFILATNSQADDRPLTFAMGPYYSKEKIQVGFAPLISYLSEKLERPVELIITDTYEELEEEIKSGKLDLGILGPGGYVELKARYPELKYVINTQTTKGGKTRAFYFAYFISHKASGLTKMKHLHGKTFSFVSKKSSSGYKYPMLYFKKRNQNPDVFFSKVVFAGSHEAVTDKIANKEIDAGVTWDVNLWTAEQKHGRIFTRIKKIGPMVTPLVAAHHKMDDVLLKQIVDALQNTPKLIFNKNLAFTGFTVLPDEDFNTVRESLKEFNVH